ncbi:NifU-like protein [Candidatus Sulfotelmatomonas gaucii]|uniref:NifU-like protein n=1 Tax=Candidatus Sulfuritelmatomonas gaucii TaxID=2043161 RepID=A0A2N9L6C0_9BACT|nr:NifU-like protein [Candidatus Sulfotelmatomonas gaucii]
MTDDLGQLYQEVILEHSKAPRNYRKPESANREAEGYNPLCGDRCTVFLDVEGDAIKDIGFQGSGCAISRASASMMTQSVKGKTKAEAARLFEEFHRLVTGDEKAIASAQDLGKLAVFAGVSKFPARVKCATLAWHTLQSALENKHEPVSTEE